MNKHKFTKIFSRIYGIVMVIIFAAFCLAATSAWGGNRFDMLMNRLIVSLMFLVPGTIFLKFKGGMLKVFYTRDGLVFKDEASRQKAIESIIYFGSHMLATAIIIIALALLLYIVP